MISEELESKYKNHLKKALAYDEADLSGLFDKFKSLYVCYNMLFAEIPDLLRAQGATLKGNDHDSKMATTYLHRYLVGDDIMTQLMDQNSEDFNNLVKVIKLDIFNIKLNAKQQPQKDQDALLLAGLESDDLSENSLAILKIIYQVRCNDIHGSKDFIEHQRLLLDPLVHLLETLVSMLYNKLCA